MRAAPCGPAAIAGALLCVLLAGAAPADEKRLIRIDDARNRGAIVEVDKTRAPNCRAEVQDAPEHSLVFELNCTGSGGGGVFTARFVAFARMLLNPEWSVADARFERTLTVGGGSHRIRRSPINDTRNLWTEVEVDAPPGGHVRVAASITAKTTAGPALSCGANPSWLLRAPADLPYPGAPLPAIDDMPFVCRSDADCAGGWRCDLRCGGVCDRR